MKQAIADISHVLAPLTIASLCGGYVEAAHHI